MTKAERHARKSGWRPDLPGREEFVRENAVSLLAERDRKIVRMREEIRKLIRKWTGLQAERDRLAGTLAASAITRRATRDEG